MWYQKDPKGYKWEELLTLYRIASQNERGVRDDLFRFTHFYSAVCYAILGITLYGFVYLSGKGPFVIFLLLGPVMTLWMCFLALRVTKRIYRRIMYEISIKIKLENALGLDQALPVKNFYGQKPVWEKDESLLPAKYAKRRFQEDSSQKFVDSTHRGSFYRDNRMYFGIIAIFAVILAVVITFSAVVGCPW